MKEYKYKINGNLYKVLINSVEDTIAHVEVNGTPYAVELEEQQKKSAPKISKPAVPKAVEKAAPVIAKPAQSSSKQGVKSPLPGVILDVKVAVGDAVKKGQTILILEAMKMENNINATKDGTVTEIKVSKGDSVLEGTDLIIIE